MIKQLPKRFPNPIKGDEGGFSLIEMVVVVALSAIIMLISMTAMMETQEVTNERLARSNVELNARALMDKMVKSIRQSGIPQMTIQDSPDGGTDNELSFNIVSGFDAGANPVWSTDPIVFSLRNNSSENIADDADNNGDGIIDEGRVLAEWNTTESSTIGDYVTELDFKFAPSKQNVAQLGDQTVEITMTMVRRSPNKGDDSEVYDEDNVADEDGDGITDDGYIAVTLQQQVFLRN